MGCGAEDRRVREMTGPLDRIVRMTARALGRAGLVHAYGHCSARIDADRFLACPPRPMAQIRPAEPCTEVPVIGGLPDGVLGEVRLHQRLYQTRPHVGGVIRFMGPSVMAMSALGRVPEIRHGFGTYFSPKVGLWQDIQLVRSDEKAIGAIEAMGQSAGLILGGNGAVVAGETLRHALCLAFYLEDMCRVELAVLATGLAASSRVISPVDAAERATGSGGIFDRMWDHLTFGDPELENEC